MKRSKTFLIIGIIILIISITFTFLIKKIDISHYNCRPSCPFCTDIKCEEIGFSSINKTIAETFQYNELLYKLTNYLGYIPIAFAGVYAIFGIAQLIKRKSFKKIDKGLFALAGLFIVALATYFVFEKLAINYRPVMINGELEASFPSSHTMLILCISAGIIFFNRFYYPDNKPLKFLNIFLAFLATLIVVGRFLSGVHWTTDIIGGLLFATSFIATYCATLLKTSHKHDKIEKTKQGN